MGKGPPEREPRWGEVGKEKWVQGQTSQDPLQVLVLEEGETFEEV